ncbi:hypothetical protein IEQ34_001760 [Dendrobium chrysotoxum]|uniref:Uncharacterized protein n=1 Tax=Dendrobium chrysotoxum TaxID=161865 RepID=A0AAV7HMR6_DENCH|nr:hypothetical protein IEQ34_001760 [Dendrobium chrysotoxum]
MRFWKPATGAGTTYPTGGSEKSGGSGGEDTTRVLGPTKGSPAHGTTCEKTISSKLIDLPAVQTDLAIGARKGTNGSHLHHSCSKVIEEQYRI